MEVDIKEATVEVIKVLISMLVQSLPHHIHFQEAMPFLLKQIEITNNLNPKYKKFRHIKMLVHHMLEEQHGEHLTLN
jgi:hypothetical protein